jgi:hypothetical protein
MRSTSQRLQRKPSYQSYHENESQYHLDLFGLFNLNLSGTFARTGLVFRIDIVIGRPLLAGTTILSRDRGSLRGTEPCDIILADNFRIFDVLT